MRISLILCHPYPRSLNHALAERVADEVRALGHELVFHDLYAERFDPVITGRELVADDVTIDTLVEQHCAEIRAADGIAIVHPNWWGMPPAVMKGWIDRVLRPGVAYEFADDDDGSGVPTGLLQARTAIVLNTSNTPEARETAVFGDPLETLWKNCVFGFCGVRDVRRRMFRVVASSTAAERAGWLEEAAALVRETWGG